MERYHGWLEWNLFNTSTKICGKCIQSATVFLWFVKQSICNCHLPMYHKDQQNYSQVFSKARNALKKKLSIPRLELMSVLTGARSLCFVAKAMKLEKAEKILRTDSQCVQQWIKNRENTSAFVRNRIIEIINETDVAFRYINTKHNPADIHTRNVREGIKK